MKITSRIRSSNSIISHKSILLDPTKTPYPIISLFDAISDESPTKKSKNYEYKDG